MTDLTKLSEPFPADDIEWRVSRAGKTSGDPGIWCNVLAYITARGIQHRLDEVVGPENWRLEPPKILEHQAGKYCFAAGISIRITDAVNVMGEDMDASYWVTKWDVSEPTTAANIDAAKGGWSGAIKRAGAQWGIGRYLYRLDETFTGVSLQKEHGWTYAKLSPKNGGDVYYWKPPTLPGWALPKEPEHEITEDGLKELKKAWRNKFAPDVTDPGSLRDGFTQFVKSVCGDFPLNDYTCWTADALIKCRNRIDETEEPGGVSAEVPFDAN